MAGCVTLLHRTPSLASDLEQSMLFIHSGGPFRYKNDRGGKVENEPDWLRERSAPPSVMGMDPGGRPWLKSWAQFSDCGLGAAGVWGQEGMWDNWGGEGRHLWFGSFLNYEQTTPQWCLPESHTRDKASTVCSRGDRIMKMFPAINVSAEGTY